MVEKKMKLEFGEHLLTEESDESNLTAARLSQSIVLTLTCMCRSLFKPDSLKDKHKGEKVSESLYQLHTRYRGVDGIANSLDSNIKAGIQGNPKDIEARIQKYGTNKTKARTTQTFFELVMDCFEDRILQILIAAAIVSLVVGVLQNGVHGLIEGVSILVSIVIIVSVTSVNNWIKEKQFQELQRKQDCSQAVVIRAGITQTVSSEDLVVGDVVKIEPGKTIPADCLLIQSTDISVDESALTGESEQISKEAATEENYASNPQPFLLKSTTVESGEGRALVLAVGDNTQAGKIDNTLDVANDMTPLQLKLETIADQIGMVGFYVAIFTFAALVIRLTIAIMMSGTATFLSGANVMAILNYFIIAVTIVVVAVPEGLPLAVTISLAYSVKKMFDEKNLVKRLEAAETMGGANEICSDKTGTLTQNRMTVQAFYMAGQVQNGDQNPALVHHSNAEILAQAVVYNSSAHVETEQGLKVPKGNVTEVGLLKYLMASKVDVEALIRDKEAPGFIEFQIPFNSTRKRQTTAIRMKNGKVRVFVKGGPEIVIEHCNKMLTAQNEAAPLSEKERSEILGEKVVKKFAGQCYRTLLVAYVDFTDAEWQQLRQHHNNFQSVSDQECVENGLTMVGIFGLMDPLRPGIRDAVEQCRRSGINVRMVTGDNLDTAIAISREAGIITDEDLATNEDGYLCMTGKQFREIVGGITSIQEEDGKRTDHAGNKRAFREVAKKLKVLARSSPEDKYLLVTGLKDEGAVVAVTGDGTNDAPALNRADIGFAMGNGTDVAKNASDIVLTDDNFCSVLTAVRYGRNIYDGVRKFLQFQITVNLVALFIVFAGALIFSDPPLTAVQMLWVNLIMDTFAALALATEPPSDQLLDRQPVSRFEKIVNATMWRNIIGQGVYQIVVLLIMLFFGQDIFGLPFTQATPFYIDQAYIAANPGTTMQIGAPTNKTYLYTMIFQIFVFMQLFNQINARKLGAREFNVFAGFFNNGLFLFIAGLTFVVQIAMVNYGGQSVRAVPLSTNDNLICLAIGAFSLIWGVIIKLVLPPSLFNSLAISEREMTDAEESQTVQAQLRRSYRQSRTSQQRQQMTQEELLVQSKLGGGL